MHRLEKELEELIQSEPAIWRFLREGSLDGVWFWDIESPDDEWMSPEFWRLFGIDPETKQHKASEWQSIIFKEDLALALENFKKHCADPNHAYDQIVRYRHADGGVVWVRCRGVAIRDPAGKPIRMLGAHNDLTQIRRLALDTELVFDAASDAIIGVAQGRAVVAANASAREFLGGVSAPTPFRWPVGIHFLDADSLAPLGEDDDPLSRALRGETLRHETVAMSRRNGERPRYLRASSVPQSEASSEVRAILVLADTTELEVKRQQLERSSRLDALGKLAGGIAHDFNNLLAIIQYSLDAARVQPDRSEVFMQAVASAVKRGGDLTERLLAFARRQPGRARSRLAGEVLSELMRLARPAVEESIDLECADNIEPLYVYCDQGQLEIALLNLIINARDAILSSGVGSRIRVSARPVEGPPEEGALRGGGEDTFMAREMRGEYAADQSREDGRLHRYVEFAVTDDGPGMSEEVKRRAIDPFFTTKDVKTGTGLGLSIVYGFVQQAGGELRIYSEKGQGATVRLLLPRGDLDIRREAPAERVEAPQGSGQTILLVEDEEHLLEATREILICLGYQVAPAKSGAAALQLLENGVEIDLLLTDVVMPGGVGGFDLARQVREQAPGLPVIYMSGYTGFDRDQMGDVVAPLLQKPCDQATLAKAINSALAAPAEKPAER